MVILDRSLDPAAYDHGTGFAADLADGHDLLVEMIHHNLRLEADGVFLAFDVAAQFLPRPLLIELRVVLYFFNQAVKAFHRRVGAQHIEDETLLDRLLHRVAVEWAVLDLAFGIRGQRNAE